MDAELPLLVPNVGANDLLALLQTAMANSTLHLCKAVVPDDPATVLADLTAIEADYTGYAAKTIVAFSGPFDIPDVGASILSPLENFSPTGTAVANTIYGGWLQDAAGNLLFAFQLPTPTPLTSPTDVLSVILQPEYPGPGTVHQID